ncbi:MAG TPA: NAD-dependent epimerase/dehydratase family protein [Chloroflexota bacterium]|nr:NAD-dependent epimerase/dehydratase family protein [Chloroflexota bacterium]
MKVLVTGGAGFIGSHLVEELLARGHEVHVVDALTTSARANLAHLEGNPRLRVTIDTILNEPLMDAAIGAADLVFHLAAAVGVNWILERPLESLHTNLRGTDVVLGTADRHRTPVLVASTSEVYGKNDSGPLREDDDRILGSSQMSRWFYATAKAADEALATAYWQERRLPTIAVRFFNTIGPRQTGRYGMVVPRFIGQALRNEPVTVYGDGQQTRCFTYVGDVVKSIIALAETDSAWGDVYNVGRHAEISIADLAGRVIELTGSESEVVYVPYSEAYASGFEDMRRRVPDVTKLRQTIGYAPDTPLDEALRRIISVHPSSTAPVS